MKTTAKDSAPAPAAKRAPAAGAAQAKRPAGVGVPAGDPIFSIEKGRWRIENQTAGSTHINQATGKIEVPEDQIEVRHTAYVYKSNGVTIEVPAKINIMTIDNCKNCNVIINDSVAGVEVVNCQRVKVQVNGQAPSVAIDKTDGITVYLSWASRSAQIVTSKSSEMNVSFPPSENADEWIEAPIPEQFVHRINEDGTVSAEVSSLYTH
jgi:adenylyl cyclase-associated protein